MKFTNIGFYFCVCVAFSAVMCGGAYILAQELPAVTAENAAESAGEVAEAAEIKAADEAAKTLEADAAAVEHGLEMVTAPVAAAPAEVKNEAETASVKAETRFTLPEICPMAADMTLAPWGDVLVACPNTADRKHPPVLMRVSPENKSYLWAVSPIDPQTGTANPVFLCFGKDGNLYLCDNQSAAPQKASGRVIRMLVNEQGRAYSAEVVAYGLKNPVGLAIHDDTIYVLNRLEADTQTDAATSVVHFFPLDAVVMEVKNVAEGPTVMAAFVSTEDQIFPAFDRMAADGSGTLYLAASGEGKLFSLPAVPAEDAGGKAGAAAEKKTPELTPVTVPVSEISAMAVDAAGVVYILDAAKNELGLLGKDGKYHVLAAGVLPAKENAAPEKSTHYALCFRGRELILLCSPPSGLPTVSVVPVKE